MATLGLEHMPRLTTSNWRWIGAAIIGSVIAVLLIFGAVQAAVEQSPVCQQQAQQHQSESHSLPATETHQSNAHPAEQQLHFCYRGHTAEEWIGILTALLAGFTWALAMATAALWLDARSNGQKQLKAAALNLRTARTQLHDAREGQERALRAHLFIEKAQVIFTGGEVSTAHIDVGFKNFGQTPAYKVTVQWYADVLHWPVDDLTVIQDPETSVSLGSGGDRGMRRKLEMSPETHSAIMSATVDEPAPKALVVWGLIGYRDVFNVRRRTKFTLFLGGGAVPTYNVEFLHNGDRQRIYNLHPHNTGNEAD